MSVLIEALQWLADPGHWGGETGIAWRTAQHLGITVLVVALAMALAVPVGTWIGHTGRGRWLVSATGAARAVPTLGVLTLTGLALGIGLAAPAVALLVLALPPMLAGTYSGIASTDRTTVDAARAIGLTEWQVVTQVEVPHAMAIIMAGVRGAVLQVIAISPQVMAQASGQADFKRHQLFGLRGGVANHHALIASAVVVNAACNLRALLDNVHDDFGFFVRDCSASDVLVVDLCFGGHLASNHQQVVAA